MALPSLYAFTQMGSSFIITTNGTGSTTQSTPITIGTGGLLVPTYPDYIPGAIRCLNKGTADIWVSFTSPASATAVIPVAGTTTIGTPQAITWFEPGVDLIFTFPTTLIMQNLSGAQGFGFWMNTICTAASQNLQCQLGEGQ